MRSRKPLGMGPGGLLLAGALACVLVGLLVTWFALRQPWLGLRLEPDFDGNTVTITHAEGPASGLPTPSELVSLRAEDAQDAHAIVATDIIEEPDFFDTYAEMQAHFLRQTTLVEALGAPADYIVEVTTTEKSN